MIYILVALAVLLILRSVTKNPSENKREANSPVLLTGIFFVIGYLFGKSKK